MIVRRKHTPFLNNIDRIFDEFWRNADTASPVRNAEYALALNVKENDRFYTVSTALPGVKAEDINIRLEDDVLSITAEISEEKVEEGEQLLLKERRYGNFSRSLRLPVTVVADAIEANYENGLLTVNVPKAEEAQPRAIQVKVASK